LTQVPMVTRN